MPGFYDPFYAGGSFSLSMIHSGVGIVIDGGGSPILPGIAGDVIVPFSGILTSVTMLADQVGSVEVDIWKNYVANYPPDAGASLCGGNLPAIVNDLKYQSAVLTGWSRNTPEGVVFRFNVNSAAVITRLHIMLGMQRA